MHQGGEERLDRPRAERFFETAETVDQQTLHFSFFDVAKHPIGEFIQKLIGRRLPQNLNVTGFELLEQRWTNRTCLAAYSLRRFIKPEQQPRFLGARLPEELQAQVGFAGPRRS